MGGTGGHEKNNDDITVSITNAGAKRPTLKKIAFKVHLAEMDFKVHLNLVRMIFTDWFSS